MGGRSLPPDRAAARPGGANLSGEQDRMKRARADSHSQWTYKESHPSGKQKQPITRRVARWT